MLKNKIKDFEGTYGIDFNQFLAHFEQGYSRSELTEAFGITEMPMRRFIYSLGLEFSKAKRQASIDEFKYNLSREEGYDVDLVKELEQHNHKLEEKVGKLYKSLTHARDEANHNRKALREQARSENLEESITEVLSGELTDVRAELSEWALNYKRPMKKIAKTMTTDFALFSDVHFSEVVEPSSIENLNEFNEKIAEQRIDHFFDEVILKNSGNRLILFALGDLLQGIIHNSDFLNENVAPKAMVRLAKIISRNLVKLTEFYSKIDVRACGGNHGRLHNDKKQINLKHSQIHFEYLLFEFVEELVRDFEEISIHYSKSGMGIVEFPDGATAYTHGDTYRIGNKDTIPSFEEMFGTRILNVFGGHTHKPDFSLNIRGGYNLSNGAMNGMTNYSTSMGFSPIKPAQIFGRYDTRGNVIETHIINFNK